MQHKYLCNLERIWDVGSGSTCNQLIGILCTASLNLKFKLDQYKELFTGQFAFNLSNELESKDEKVLNFAIFL